MKGLDLSKAKRRPASMIRHADSACPNEHDIREGHLDVGDWIHCAVCHTSHQLIGAIHTEIVG